MSLTLLELKYHFLNMYVYISLNNPQPENQIAHSNTSHYEMQLNVIFT